MTTYEIDGSRFSTLEEFYDEITRALSLTSHCGGNLDAFDDVLQGGFGTPVEGFTIRWKNHGVSKERLGYSETARQLRLRLEQCHPTNRARVSKDLEMAISQKGKTVFDWLIEVIRDHGPGGKQKEDRVQLLLD
jgi:RNAse (barnase) inhibitor barstar